MYVFGKTCPYKLFRVRRVDTLEKKLKAYDRLKSQPREGRTEEEVANELQFITSAYDMMSDEVLENAYHEGGWEAVNALKQFLVLASAELDEPAENAGEVIAEDITAAVDGSVQTALEPSGGTAEIGGMQDSAGGKTDIKSGGVEAQDVCETGDKMSQTDATDDVQVANAAAQTEGVCSDYYNGRRLQELEEERKKLQVKLLEETKKREKIESKAAELKQKETFLTGELRVANEKIETLKEEIGKMKKRSHARIISESEEENAKSEGKGASDGDEGEGSDGKSKDHPPKSKSRKKSHPCLECGEVFTRSTTLRRHIESIHQGKTFACKDCNFKFKRADYLEKHKCANKN